MVCAVNNRILLIDNKSTTINRCNNNNLWQYILWLWTRDCCSTNQNQSLSFASWHLNFLGVIEANSHIPQPQPQSHILHRHINKPSTQKTEIDLKSFELFHCLFILRPLTARNFLQDDRSMNNIHRIGMMTEETF